MSVFKDELKKAEPKYEPKPEEPKEVVRETVRTEIPKIILNQTDAYVYERMKSQPDSLRDVEIKVGDDNRDPNTHHLTLPKEFDQYKPKFAFRWIMKSKKAIDEACDVRGWVLVNKTYFPDIPDHFFTVSGSVERGDLILAFMSEKKAEKLRAAPREQSAEMVSSTFSKHKEDPRFYAPSETGENVKMI